MPYYERPNMVLNALNSFRAVDYEDYTVAIIDDGSVRHPVKAIVEKAFPDLLKKIRFYNTEDTIENKMNRGSIHGAYMNLAIKEIECDIVAMISDDDAIHSKYFKNLHHFYKTNPNVMYSYSHVILFDPSEQVACETMININNGRVWNSTATTNINWTAPINPYCKIDATQVSWRRECSTKDGIFLPEQQTKNLDASFYLKMHEKYGNCVFNGAFSAFKGIHSEQLSNKSGISQYTALDSKKKNNYISVYAKLDNFDNNAIQLENWLQYHISLGIEHFYLYEKQNETGFRTVLKPFYDDGLITLKVQAGSQEALIHEDFLSNYKLKTYWAIFLETTEFLHLDDKNLKGKTLKQLISSIQTEETIEQVFKVVSMKTQETRQKYIFNPRKHRMVRDADVG
jgi:hypothetical protein